MLATLSVAKAQIPATGLVGYYQFNTNANDATGISSNGVLNGSGITYTTNRFGATNAAIHFGTGGYVSITPTPVNVNSDYSISFWAKFDNSSSTPYNLLSTDEDNFGGMNFRVYPGAFGWAFIAQGSSAPTSATPNNFTAWHSVICIHQSTNDYMYIDGALKTTGSHTNATIDTGSLWIGRHQNPGGFNYDFLGAMDDVRFYNRALSAGEASQLYGAELNPPPPVPTNGLVAFYTFTANANDSTGVSSNGVLNGNGISYTTNRFGSNNAAIHFGGGGYLSITPTPVNVNTDYTISFWTKFDNANNTPYNLFSTQEENLGGMNFRVYPGAFGWAFIAQGSSAPTSPVPTNFTAWHAVVCVHQGTNDYMYIDSVLETSGGHTNATVDTGSIWIGRHQNPGGNFNYDFQGAMDDIRFYNRAMPSNEVSQLYIAEQPSTPPQPLDPTNGLVGFYPFTGTANDQTAISHNGALNGSGITFASDRFGNSNAAVHFSGGGYISITPTPVNVNSNYSITFWTKFDNANSTPYNLLSTDQDNLGGMNFRVYPGAFGWAFIAQGSSAPTASSPSSFTSWHAVACVHQGTNDYMYIDGALATAGGHTNATVDLGSIWIGRHQNATPFNYDMVGEMDDIRFYSRALSASDAAQLYALEMIPPPPPRTNGLVAYYAFNGNTVDAISNLNGTVSGSGITYTTNRYGSSNTAVHFAGNGHISISPTPVDVNLDYSVSLWVKLDNANSTPYNLLSTAQDTLGGMNIRTYAGVFGWAFIAQGSSGPVSATPKTFTQWHSLVCVRSGTNDLFYIDGALMTSGSHTNATVDNGSIWIGQHQSGATYDLHGAVDDVRFYNYALTASDVGQLLVQETLGMSQPATATVTQTNGFIVGINVISGGFGYTNVPVVRLIGGGGTNAVATAVVSNGVVVAINISNPGSGYTNDPVVVVAPPFIVSPELKLTELSLLTYRNLLIGTNYQLQSFHGDFWVNEPVSFIASDTNYIQYLSTLDYSGYMYRLVVKPAPQRATATAQIAGAGGFFVGGTITFPGVGYTNDVMITVSGGGGTNGAAIAQVGNGVVTNIFVINPGSNYLTKPILTIAPPPAGPGISPVLQTLLLRLNASSLAPYENYQIQFTENLATPWSNYFVGNPLVPTSSTNSQILPMISSNGFFRLQHASTP